MPTCVQCGHLLHLGDARVVVAFNTDELDALAFAATHVGVDQAVVHRLLCALGLLDAEREQKLRAELLGPLSDPSDRPA